MANRGCSSVYLPIRFFYYLAKLIIFARSIRVPCIFFLEGEFKGIYLRERNFTLSYVVSEICFSEGSAPTFHGEALGILYNQTFFCTGLEYLFMR